jgi:Zn-dependent peptidase ImmA (M78 family)
VSRVQFFFFIFYLLGCVEDIDGLYIDSACTAEEREMIYEAVDKMNEALGHERIFISGVHAKPADPLNDDLDMIVCYDAGGGEETAGKTVYHDILIYRNNVRSHDTWLSTIMHELGHYIAPVDHRDHICDVTAVMNPQLQTPPLTEYSPKDIQLFKSLEK